MFEVARPLMAPANSDAKQTSALNDGVSVSDVNANITKAIAQNRAKRKRGVEHMKRIAKY